MPFLLILAASALLHLYLGWRLVSSGSLEAGLATGAWISLGLCFVAIPASFLLRGGESLPRRALRWIAYLWMGLFGPLIAACWVLEAGLATGRLALALGVDWAWIPEAWLPSWSAGAFAFGVLAVTWGLVRTRLPAKLERRTVRIEGLGAGLEGLRIVQVSDVHVGPTVDAAFVEKMVRRVNALEPDIIAVTGDLVDAPVPSIEDGVAPLAGFEGKLGTFYVLGNHELYHGAHAWLRKVAELGMIVLHNEHRVLERGGARLTLAGVSDHDGGRFDASLACRPAEALEGAPEGVPRVLLAHQPRVARLAGGLGIDLQLSGHTHGGQIFPFMFFVKLQQPTVRGFATVNGVRVYTHRGTGWWGPPIRIGSAPEIALLTLTS